MMTENKAEYIIRDNVDLYNSLNIDSKKQNTMLFKPGPYWDLYSKRIEHEILKSGLNDFRGNINIGKGFADVISSDPFSLARNRRSLAEKFDLWLSRMPLIKSRIVRRHLLTSKSFLDAMKTYRSELLTIQFKDLFSELISKLETIDHLIGKPNNTAVINGQEMGMVFFRAAVRLSSFAKNVNFETCNTLFEIGGGFGATTELILRMYPNIKKVIYLDISPNLYIGTQYLKSVFGDSVRDYLSLKDVQNITFLDNDDKVEILCIPPWLISKVNVNIDLFYNSESFQEMPSESINEYAKHLGRLFNDKKEKKICLWFYEHTGVANTISPPEVINILEKNIKLPFKKFDPTFDLNDKSSWYYLA